MDTVFGLPGDGINGIMEGLRRHQEKVRFVLVQHEEAAAFMATGYAHAPVLAITGMQATSLLGTGFQQEVQLERLFEDVAEYNALVHVPVQIQALVDNAVRTALARRTVAHLTSDRLDPVPGQARSAARLAPVSPGGRL